MRYTLKLLWHGAILLGRVGWIVGGALASLFLAFISKSNDVELSSESEAMMERPSISDINHRNWDYYCGD